MAKTIDIELQKQLDKPQAWFCKYFPARIRNVSEREIADRKLVFDFKEGIRRGCSTHGSQHDRTLWNIMY